MNRQGKSFKQTAFLLE